MIKETALWFWLHYKYLLINLGKTDVFTVQHLSMPSTWLITVDTDLDLAEVMSVRCLHSMLLSPSYTVLFRSPGEQAAHI